MVMVLVVAILAVNHAAGQPDEVRPGMSPEQVTRLLGEPDRKAVLVGKALRSPDDLSADEAARLRLVYIYEPSGLQVWFQNGKVTGVTRQGVSPR
jgi:hypothetical protein